MIVKTIITLTILHEADTLESAANRITSMSLGDLGYMIEEGDGVGDYVITHMDEVPQDKVHAELLELGNDGTFFQSEDEETA